jgi:hypothetical protein
VARIDSQTLEIDCGPRIDSYRHARLIGRVANSETARGDTNSVNTRGTPRTVARMESVNTRRDRLAKNRIVQKGEIDWHSYQLGDNSRGIPRTAGGKNRIVQIRRDRLWPRIESSSKGEIDWHTVTNSETAARGIPRTKWQESNRPKARSAVWPRIESSSKGEKARSIVAQLPTQRQQPEGSHTHSGKNRIGKHPRSSCGTTHFERLCIAGGVGMPLTHLLRWWL